MKKGLLAVAVLFFMAACQDGDKNTTSEESDTTTAVRNAEGADNNAYNLPGADTTAIHENTSQPGVLDKDASDSAAR